VIPSIGAPKAASAAYTALALIGIRLNEDVDIFCGAWLGVKGNRASTDDKVFNAVGVEGPQQFFEVGEHPAGLLSCCKWRA
jgi:hypothetical protein